MTGDAEPQQVADDAAVLRTDRVVASWSPDRAALDPAVRAAGEAHLARTLATWTSFYDGPVGCLSRLGPDGAVLAVGSFFDVLRSDAAASDPDGRATVTALAGGDPLRSGAGRAAAVGVSLLLARGEGAQRRVLAGLRSAEVLNPGTWHTVPAGTVHAGEPDAGQEPIRATAVQEAHEELGLTIDPGAIVPLGWAWDLGILRPEAVLLLEADDIPVGEHCAEHDEIAWLPLADPPPAAASPVLRAALLLAAEAA